MKINKLKREIDEFLENPKNTKQACLDMLHQIRSELDEVEIEVIEKVVIKEVEGDVKKQNIVPKKPKPVEKKPATKGTNWF